MNEGNLREKTESSSNRKGFPNKNDLNANWSFTAQKAFCGGNGIHNEFGSKYMQPQSSLKKPNTLSRGQGKQFNHHAKLTLKNFKDADFVENSGSQIYSPKTTSVKSNSNNNNRKDHENKNAISSDFSGLNSLSSSVILKNNLNNNYKLNTNNNSNSNKPNTDYSCDLKHESKFSLLL